MRNPVFVLCLILAPALVAAQQPLYLNPAQPLDRRVDDLVGRLTLDEKIGQMVHGAHAIPRLNIPAYNWWNEGLHGVARNGLATVFPQAIGIGASFDADLQLRIATAISDEARAKYHEALKKGHTDIYQGLTFWSPNINLFRDPRWGRGQETFGEDPYLSATLGVAFVKGMQGTDPRYFKTIATAKHYAVHSGPEPERHRFDAQVGRRDLFQTYLPAFEALVREGKVYSVMSAYNRINGSPASANKLLLETILREKWGFKGYVVSDCGAIDNIFRDHKVAATAEQAAAMAVNAGCDLECGGAYAALKEAVRQGFISEATINKSVKRLFEARMRLGMFDPLSSQPYSKIPMSVVDSPAHRRLALEAAQKSIVLLKNAPRSNGKPLLPLDSKPRTIAVVGPNADDKEVLWGNYNGIPSHTVTLLDGIRKGAPAGSKVLYAKGSDINSAGSLTPIPAEHLRSDYQNWSPGLRAEYFDNKDLRGEPKLRRVDQSVNFDWQETGPGVGFGIDNFSIRWRGLINAPVTGEYTLGITNDDGMRVWLNGKQIFNDWNVHAPSTSMTKIEMERGKSYEILIEYFEQSGGAVAKLQWSLPRTTDYADAISVANQADVVVACVGINGSVENEGQDRAEIGLPVAQERMLKAMFDTGKPVIVALVSGSPIAVNASQEHAAAILQTWYGGQEAGTALADVLFGRYNPAGRLPVTFYRSLAQVPAFEDYAMSNRTYRYMKDKPLYPFGFGLSYTTFRYSGMQVPATSKVRESVEVSVDVQNVGGRAGDEVVQMYLGHIDARLPVPIRQLGGFKRIHLKPNEKRNVKFTITRDQLAFIDETGNRAYVPGLWRVWIGNGLPNGTNGSSYLPGDGGYRTLRVGS